MGMVDLMLFHWRPVDIEKCPEKFREQLLQKAADPAEVGVAICDDLVCEPVGEKLAYSKLVWQSSRKQAQKQSTPATPAHAVEE